MRDDFFNSLGWQVDNFSQWAEPDQQMRGHFSNRSAKEKYLFQWVGHAAKRDISFPKARLCYKKRKTNNITCQFRLILTKTKFLNQCQMIKE